MKNKIEAIKALIKKYKLQIKSLKSVKDMKPKREVLETAVSDLEKIIEDQ